MVIVLGVFCFLLTVVPVGIASAQSKTVNMKFAYGSPPKGPLYNGVFVNFVEEIKTRSNGQLNIKIYPSGTLLKWKAQWKGIVKAIADVTWDIHVYNKGLFPLSLVLSLPFLSPSNAVGTAVLHDLYNEFPEVKAEYDQVHVLWFWGTMPAEIHTTKKPVRKLEDLKGMKIASNAGSASALKGLGAVPVVMTASDYYQSLEKGVVDGFTGAYGMFNNFRLYEVTKYHTNAHLGATTTMVIMNKNRWNSLSSDMQKVLTDYSAIGRKNQIAFGLKEKAKGIENAKKTGEMIGISPSERARWVATAKPAYEAWVKKVEAKGLPGQKVLDRTLELVKKYESEK